MPSRHCTGEDRGARGASVAPSGRGCDRSPVLSGQLQMPGTRWERATTPRGRAGRLGLLALLGPDKPGDCKLYTPGGTRRGSRAARRDKLVIGGGRWFTRVAISVSIPAQAPPPCFRRRARCSHLHASPRRRRRCMQRFTGLKSRNVTCKRLSPTESTEFGDRNGGVMCCDSVATRSRQDRSRSTATGSKLVTG